MCYGTIVFRLNGLNEVVMTDVTFSNNTGYSGAAISITQSTNIVLENCTFSDNVAVEKGGGVYIDSENTKALVRHCSFLNNSAGNSAGGLYIGDNNVDIRVHNTTFEDNYAGVEGGE